MMINMKKYVYQIFYDDKSKNQLLPGFIPLDNTTNQRPDWFEFWVILNYLRQNELEEGAWYGFLSPKFFGKMGYASDVVNHVLDTSSEQTDVALFSPGWDQLSFFLNPFEQGEVWHPGLLAASQKFLDELKMKINLQSFVTDANSSVFSNYIVAKKRFWSRWQTIAENFFNHVESSSENQSLTHYGVKGNILPMKVFVQERLASIILSTENFNVVTPNHSFIGQIFNRLFPDDIETRILLQTCNLMKSNYRSSGEEEYLRMYWRLRAQIKFQPQL